MMDQGPRILGDYNIIKQIGQGPLGTVFLAEHRFMKKHFALKVLPQELAGDRAFIQRFEQEVSRLSKLDHPHIVKVHNISHANGLYFLVTDCIVDGMGETTNLAQYIIGKGEHLSENEIYTLLEQVADALDYAHGIKSGEKGVAHCGLKLNNILVSKGQSGVKLHISDFGLTRIVGAGAVLCRTFRTVAEALDMGVAMFSQLGNTGQYPSPAEPVEKLVPLHASFLQTFVFLAPEQKQVENSAAMALKVDNYAFGILAYYLLTGAFPEGHFDMPSCCCRTFRWNWDSLVRECLQCDPEKRGVELLPILKNVKQMEAEAPVADIPAEAPVQVQEERAIDRATLQQPPQRVMAEPLPRPQAAEPYVMPKSPAPQEYHEEEGELVAVAADSVSVPSQPHFRQAAQPMRKPTPLRPVIHERRIERPVNDPDPGAIFTMESTVTQYVPEKKEVRDVEPIMTDMMVVKKCSYMRGSNDGNRDEMPRHTVFVDSFAIDVHPVTNEQFVRFLEVLGGEKDSNHNDVIRLKDSRVKRSGGKLSIESGYGKHPVVGVTWYGACAYAKWVGKRLPTEAEWELACKGGDEEALFPTGDDIEKSQANFFSSDTTAVMSYAPNAFGLYDMAGNVYEWCQDWYGYNYYEVSVQEPDNPTGPIQGVYRVLRGGCWKSLKEDLRCSRRHRNNPGTVNGTYGFRCAADVE